MLKYHKVTSTTVELVIPNALSKILKQEAWNMKYLVSKIEGGFRHVNKLEADETFTVYVN